jgi:hypothetical protein
MRESTILECVNKFTRTMVQQYGTYILENQMQLTLLDSLKLQSREGFRGCFVA